MLEDSGFKGDINQLYVSATGLVKSDDPQEKPMSLSDLTDHVEKMLEGSGFTVIREPQPTAPPERESTYLIKGLSAAAYNLLLRQWSKN